MKNSIITFVGLKYIWSGQKRGILSLITIISVLGMALGVAALISVLSVMDGFLSEMKVHILGSTSHAHLYKLVGSFNEYETVIDKVSKVPGVTGVSPIIENDVMVAANEQIAGALASGIDLKTIGTVLNLPNQMVDGNLACLEDDTKCEGLLKNTQIADDLDALLEEDVPEHVRPVILGKDMAEKLGVKKGDIVTIISPNGGIQKEGEVDLVPVSKKFVVAGIFSTGMYDFDMKYIYLSKHDAQTFFGVQDVASYLNIKVNNTDKVKEIGASVMNAVNAFPYAVQDWMDMHKTTFKFLEMQKIVMFIILIFIILVASFGIISTLIMLVMGKTHEISILKAIGASNSTIMKIFVLDGFLIGVAGTVAGIILAIIVCITLKQIEFPLAKDLYFFKSLPVQMSISTFALVAICSLFISFVATFYPSWQASRIKPTEGLRYE